jgi:hypothetical protein
MTENNSKRKCRRWQAHAIVNGRWTNLGEFATKDDAITARRQAEARHYGEFARTGAQWDAKAEHDRDLEWESKLDYEGAND